MINDLHNAVTEEMRLKEHLRTLYPDEGDEDLFDTLDGLSEFSEIVGFVLRSIEDDQGMIEALSEQVESRTARADRFKDRISKKRSAIASAMERLDRKKILLPDFTVSLSRRSPTVLITNEAAIPSEFMKVPPLPAPKPDKARIKEALDLGIDIPGATISNGSVGITVRRS